MVGTKQHLTTEETAILLCVKALNDFKNPDYPEDTLDEKIKKFDSTSDNIGVENFKAGLKKLESMEVLESVELEDDKYGYALTAKGKVVMNALSAIKGFSDETVQKIVNRAINVSAFVKEHGLEIIGILSNIKF